MYIIIQLSILYMFHFFLYLFDHTKRAACLIFIDFFKDFNAAAKVIKLVNTV